jgi:Fe-S oxidoreductase
MARLKAEFLHQYYRERGLPWRNWIFGNVARLAGTGWGTSWFARTKFGRWLNEKLFGIDRRRLPPRPAREDFELDVLAGIFEYDRKWIPQALLQTWQKDQTVLPQVRFFHDTFVTYYEPALGLAATEVMVALGNILSISMPGWKRHSFPPGDYCCGRPMISNGMLDEAKARARRIIAILHPWAAEGRAIVGCEPSCILTIKDDYPALLRGEERRQAETLAAHCFTFEEFVESRLSAASTQRVRFKAGPKRILVQGHCHQRSLVGMGPILRLLRRIPGAEVIDLDAGCCGMAGSFGYEKEHYEVSRLVGEQRLFPALRQAAPEDVIVAPGFSCRLQIQHFTGRTAVHPAQLLASLLEEGAASA